MEALDASGFLRYKKSRCQGISVGDKNSSCFRTKTVIRRQKNKIKSAVGKQSPVGLGRMAKTFYRKLFSKKDSTSYSFPVRGLFPVEEQFQIDQLISQISDEEIKTALFEMKPFKAPGPDGFQAFFYQTRWRIVRPVVWRYIRDMVEGKVEMSGVNHSYLVLLPKISSAHWPLQCYL
jgi:hypothetical protein